MSFSLPSAAGLSRLAAGALAALLGLWVLLCLAALVFMSLGTDEAWALNGLRSLLRPAMPDLSSELIVTNGGLYAALNLAVEALLGSRVWAHRLVSLVALGLACLLVLRQAAPPNARLRGLGLAVLLAVPGLAEVGTAALGTSVGLALMIASMVVWTSPGRGNAQRAVVGGLLYGLAAASRFDLVLFGAAVLLCSLLTPAGPGRVRWRLDPWALLFVALGGALFLGHQALMGLAVHATPGDVVADATGLSGWSLNYPKLLNQWQVLVGFAPPLLLAALALGATQADAGTARAPQPSPRLDTLLLVTGAVLLLAWLLRAPIPHLRYALPGLFCFSALGARALLSVAYSALAAGRWRQVLACQALAVACAAGALPSLTRSVLMSDSDYASWEWSHEMALDYFRRFEAWQDQRQVAQYLREQVPAEARVYATVPFALRYLAQRPVVDLSRVAAAGAAPAAGPRLLVLSPAVGSYFHLRPQSALWLQQNASLSKQIGRYSIYSLPPGGDADLRNLQLDRSNYHAHPGSTPWFGRR